jgi:hypothetical protein
MHCEWTTDVSPATNPRECISERLGWVTSIRSDKGHLRLDPDSDWSRSGRRRVVTLESQSVSQPADSQSASQPAKTVVVIVAESQSGELAESRRRHRRRAVSLDSQPARAKRVVGESRQ